MFLKPFFIFKATVCKEKKKKLFDRSLPDFLTDRFKKKKKNQNFVHLKDFK